VIPGVVYVWNGAAWASTQLSHVPDSETVVGGVRFVRLENPKPAVKPTFEVTMQDMNSVVIASVKTTAERTQQAVLEAQRLEIQKQIAELQKQVDALANQEYELNRKLQSDADVLAVNNLVYKQYGSVVTVNQSVLDIQNNDQQLHDLVVENAQKLGITLSEKEIADAVKRIKGTMISISPKV
jgi:uncharacterized protein YxjI